MRRGTDGDTQKQRFEKRIVLGQQFQHVCITGYINKDRQGVFGNRLIRLYDVSMESKFVFSMKNPALATQMPSLLNWMKI